MTAPEARDGTGDLPVDPEDAADPAEVPVPLDPPIEVPVEDLLEQLHEEPPDPDDEVRAES